jgi:hypothetical protein
VVDGDAEQITDDDVLERLADAWAKKWDGRWQNQARNAEFLRRGRHRHPGVVGE